MVCSNLSLLATVLRDEPQQAATSSLLPSSCPDTNDPFPTTLAQMHLPYMVHIKIRSTKKLGPQFYYGLKPPALMHGLGTVPLAYKLGGKFQIVRNRYDAHKMLKQKYFVYSIVIRNSHAASLLSSSLLSSPHVLSCLLTCLQYKMYFSVSTKTLGLIKTAKTESK